jgi:hypothetical protein
MHLVEARPDFAQLDDASWDDITNRGSVSRAAITLTEYGGDGDTFTPDGFLQQDYEAAWSVLQAVSMDPTYLTRTEYNLFTLLRQGNEFSVYEPVSASFFSSCSHCSDQSGALAPYLPSNPPCCVRKLGQLRYRNYIPWD